MEDLVVLSTSMVYPRNVNQSGRFNKIVLTPFDIFNFHLCYVQRGLLFPKLVPKIDIISRLKTSLSVTLDRFYPFAGQLVTVEKNGHTVSAFINCDGVGGSGVKFVHAKAKTIAVIDLVKPGLVNGVFFRSFFPANGIKNYQGVSDPLLMVQVTEMKDGVFIGFGYNSGVVDDSTIWMFLKTWSEICSMDSGMETFSPPPLVLEGSLYDGNHQQVHCMNSVIERPCYDSSTSTNILQEIVFHLANENVLKLKAKADEEIESSEEKDGKISSLQVVLGYIWRSMIKHGDLVNLEEKTHCLVPEDTRHIIKTTNEECFGNLCWTELATVTVQELLDHGLGWAAMKINKGGPKTGPWVNIVEVPVGFGSNSLVVTSSPRFNVYENDFGWGKPIAARAGPPYLSGRLVVFNGVEEGSLDLQVCLPSQVVVNLLKDVEFLEYVNIP